MTPDLVQGARLQELQKTKQKLLDDIDELEERKRKLHAEG